MNHYKNKLYVIDLINKLKKLDPFVEICIDGYDIDNDSLDHPKKVDVHSDNPYYYIKLDKGVMS